MQQSFEHELVELVMEHCKVRGVQAEDVDLDLPVVGPGSPLDLDSLDALEVVVAVQNKYKVRIGGEEASRKVLRSFHSLADFIKTHQKEAVS